jgi:hypothetical protein
MCDIFGISQSRRYQTRPVVVPVLETAEVEWKRD